MEFKIRHAVLEDKQNIIQFLHDYWGAKHCLVTSEKLFDYQFIVDNNLRFVLAEDEHGQISAMVGYIKYRQQSSPILAVMWIKNPAIKDHLLGLQVLEHLKTLGTSLSSVGINPKTRGAYKFIGCATGKMKQYYRLNANCDKFNVAVVNEQVIVPIKTVDTGKLQLVTAINVDKASITIGNELELDAEEVYRCLDNTEGLPKDLWYINYRYMSYPFYDYKIFAIIIENEVKALIILRIINSNVIRIIDFVGQAQYLSAVANQLNELLYEHNAEYIDFYQYGIDEDVFDQIGFSLNDGTNVIPNYFEPFVQSNVDLFYATNTTACLFKGDADQDRPNFVNI